METITVGRTISNLDVGIIALYLLLMIGVGFSLRRSASGSLENFFLAGRKIPGWANGISYSATMINTDVAPAYCGWTVGTGLFIAWLYFSRFGLALMIGAVLFAMFWRRLNLFTSPEFYELRFRGNVGTIMRSWIAVRSAFIANVAWTGAGLIGIYKVAGPVLGWSMPETMLVVVPVVLLYVLMSGYIGVVTTDVVQSAVIVAGSLVLCGAVLIDFGGPLGLFESLTDALDESVVGFVPPVDHAELGLVAIVAWMVGTSVGYGGDAAPIAGSMEGQRILSCKNAREASKMFIVAQITLFLMLAAITLPALGALAKQPELYTAPRSEREMVFGNLLVAYMPTGLLGLQIAAMLAAVMSTLSSGLNFGAQVVMNDIYRRHLRPEGTERHFIWVGRGVMFLIIGLALIIAFQAESLIGIAVFMLGLSSAEYAANWAQWWWWRFNRWGRLTASFGGPVIFVLVKFVIVPDAGEYTHVLLGIVLTTLCWVTVTLLTKPESKDLLVEFYMRARPLGLWKPVRTYAGVPEPQLPPSTLLKGFGLALLGVAWIACGILSLSGLFVGRYAVALPLALAGGVGGFIFLKRYRRYVGVVDHHLSNGGSHPVQTAREMKAFS